MTQTETAYSFPAGAPCSHCGGATLRDESGAQTDYCEACGTAWADNGKAPVAVEAAVVTHNARATALSSPRTFVARCRACGWKGSPGTARYADERAARHNRDAEPIAVPVAVVTADQAERVAATTARVVANMRAEADAAEARGDVDGAAALRLIADSRERAGARVRTGARITR